MSFLKHLSIFSSILITLCQATTFTVQNNCSYPVWAAAVPGGGTQLKQGQKWVFNLDPSSTSQGRIWARTNCKFDGSGHGTCESGDCNGVLQCQSNGTAPMTLAQYKLNITDTDYIDISLVDGYNVPMEFKSESSGCAETVRCAGDINGICPTELRDPGGCHNPCTVFNNNQFCCFTGRCGPTIYSKMFKEICSDAYTYPEDDDTKHVSCPAGSNYTVQFCPPVPPATIDITNNCPYTVWPAALPGGGTQLNSGQTWSIKANPGSTTGRIWARTGCQFDGSGRGSCQTGDCGGLLQCQAYGAPPNTLAEYALKQYQNLDFFDISLVDGFNVPMEFSPTSGGCTRGIECMADINGACPAQLKAPGGCNNPCTVFKTNQYCCTGGSCRPTNYSRFFQDRCPDAYGYPKDDEESTFTCPGGTNYKVVLCPKLSSF